MRRAVGMPKFCAGAYRIYSPWLLGSDRSAKSVYNAIREAYEAGLAAERDRLMGLLLDLADEDDCWFDHHGGCQAHGYLSLKPGQKCPHAEAKELLDQYNDEAPSVTGS
jgi:hypothetical protein